MPANSSGANDQVSGRDRLLTAVIEYCAATGLGDQSLREIAAAVGSSHRMLIYHFGSRDGLLLAVAHEVEERTKRRMTDLIAARGPAAGEMTDQNILDMWAVVADPSQSDFERLFFALYSRALQGDADIGTMLIENMQGWMEANLTLATQQEIPLEVARAHTRLGIAVTCGLLLDLLLTGDRSGVDAALRAYSERYVGRWWESSVADNPRAS